MPRQDANRIALKAVSAILDAAAPLKLRINDHEIAVTPLQQPSPPWPEKRLDGISEDADGPWPGPVALGCEWDQGRCDLMLSATYWQRRNRAGHEVSLAIKAPETNRELVWITAAGHIRDTRDGDEAQVYASPSLVDRSNKYAKIRETLNQEIRKLVQDAGLPMLSPGRVDAFRMTIPGGEVLPAPAEVFGNLVRLALVKLPFRDVGEPRAIHGRPFINVDSIASRARAALLDRGAQTSSGKYIVMRRMPGGYRGYKASLDRVLQFLAESPVSVDALDRFLEDDLGLTNASMRHRYVRGFEDMGLIREDDDKIELTERARAYLADPREANLFKVLHEAYEGLLAALVVADRTGGADSTSTLSLLATICDLPELSQIQAEGRRNWLTSLGLTERIGDMDRITDAGRAILAEYAGEVDELAARLEEAESTPDGEAARVSDDDDGDGDDEPVAPEEKEKREPRNWAESRLDLQAQSVAPHVGKLVLPENLLDRICAVLSAGKHLLLVGPPGTGKTEIAHALARAASDEGYCAGLFSATASADWTTYETIGGYAIQRDNSLRFRPGAFLRAVELWQWLLIDELNRADVDKAFGELMSVLSGKHTDTPYELDDGRHVSIGNHSRQYTHWVPHTFRVLATMNTWDKTSLFRLSYALQRRFAVVHVGVPAPDAYAHLIERAAIVADADPALVPNAIARVTQLFSPEGVLVHRAIGPAMALDMVRYMRRRQTQGDAMAEAVAMFLLPQLEGLDRDAAKGAGNAILDVLRGWTSTAALQELDERYRELFPSSTGLGE